MSSVMLIGRVFDQLGSKFRFISCNSLLSLSVSA